MRQVFQTDYRAHEAMTRPARTGPELWRLGAGICLVLVVIWYGSALIWQGLALSLSEDAYRRLYDDFDTIYLPESLIVLLYSFVLFWIGPMLAAATIHGRAPLSLMGALRPAWHQFHSAIGTLLVLFVVIWVFPPFGGGPQITQVMPFQTWLALLVPALIGIVIQAGGEEVLFRGYLQSQLAARFDPPLVWMGGPSVLFGLAHYAPDTYGANAWLVVIWAVLFGLLCADLTARAGTLGPAIALHVMGNAYALLLVSPQGEMSGLALYHLPFAATDAAAVRALLPVDFLSMCVSWLALRLMLKR